MLCFRDFSQYLQRTSLEYVKFAWFLVTFRAAFRMKFEYIVALPASATSDTPSTSSTGLAVGTHVALEGVPRYSRAWSEYVDSVLRVAL